ncbi:MAG TPA: hypothetical protein VJ302_07835 [Blastocatellia bacterium]|nr:hypothetical protein [Blastocatellia bacterium]
MATPQDADLILKLYDLRREKQMRKARNYLIIQFFPQNMDDIKAMFLDRKHPEYNAYFRQVTTYWDMAAAMVNHGAIDRDLFFETNGELFAVWAKVSDHIEGLREFLSPLFLVNLEKLIASYPEGQARVQATKERLKKIAAQIAAQDKN